MAVERAFRSDIAGFLALASGVESWFGPMVDDPDFHAVLSKNIDRGTAFVVRGAGTELLGGLLTGGRPPIYRINWLVVGASSRGQGVGRRLMDYAFSYFERPCQVEVITFGPDHPAAVESGARAFYERLGFSPGGDAPTGPEGGTRQRFQLTLDA